MAATGALFDAQRAAVQIRRPEEERRLARERQGPAVQAQVARVEDLVHGEVPLHVQFAVYLDLLAGGVLQGLAQLPPRWRRGARPSFSFQRKVRKKPV